MKAQMICRYERMAPITVLQLEYSLLVRSPEWEILEALDWDLNPEQVFRLNEVCAIQTPSPYDFIEKYTRK